MGGTAFLKELVIENFMSYRYARVRFGPGLNLIIGPNGAGKSSILLALSVVLGQTYTERSRKLSELIRWGEEYARVTVRLDNRERDGKRPFPRIRRDEVVITRYLRRDGQYGFELNYRDAAKAEVVALLREVGLNPDNPLIIMHQNMVESFSMVGPQEKLLFFEEAVGLREYRERIVDARSRLSSLAEEERELRKLLDETEGTLARYREEYERLMRKRELLRRREALERELAWSKYFRARGEYDRAVEEESSLREELEDLRRELEIHRAEAARLKEALRAVQGELKEVFEEATHTSYLAGRGEAADSEIARVSGRLDEVLRRLGEVTERYIEHRVAEGVAGYRATLVEARLRELSRRLRELRRSLERLREEAEAVCPEPVETGRSPADVLGELREVDATLRFYKDVDEEAEEMYNYYKGLHSDLRRRLEDLARRRRELEAELDRRVSIWRRMVSEAVSRVSGEYSRLLSTIGATGYARVVNADSVDGAGLELVVAFKGGEARVLDAYVQSGGERTAAVMMFLLALQGYVKSPLRAVDEFDIHMDPRNREVVMRSLIDAVRKWGGQYIVITPGLLPKLDIGDANILVVQKTGEYSTVSSVGGC